MVNVLSSITGCKTRSREPLGLKEEVLGGDFGVCSAAASGTMYPDGGENPFVSLDECFEE
ncbi:hypothetical protein EWB00_002389 [Schistosoma japonicum]|uniref:Uncharacterized protein n=1 Tax=Schistosoma japonicum TaxID=6182 RepID=A0A4Z2DCB2_SCHJA|nr:hypothetical protein EWB00_002389 [Schistosoma japonicum]